MPKNPSAMVQYARQVRGPVPPPKPSAAPVHPTVQKVLRFLQSRDRIHEQTKMRVIGLRG